MVERRRRSRSDRSVGTSQVPARVGVTGVLTGRRSAWIVMLLGLAVLGAILFGVGEADREAAVTDALPVGYDSTLGVQLQQQLPDDDTSTAIVVFSTDGDITTDLRALQELVTQTRPSGGDEPAVVIPSEDKTAALAVVVVPAGSASETAERVAELRTELREAAPADVRVQVTGPAAIQADLAAVFDGANITLLAVTAAVVAVLLLITYRSPVLWIIPLAVVGLADRAAAALATHTLAAFGVPWDESTIGILSVLVFGAGTNYALLLISRYRDELRTHDSRNQAMAVALKRTAEAVGASASTVLVGLLTLLLSVVPSTRGLGLACAVGIVVAATVVLGLLPAVLVLFGRWVFWPRVPHVGQPVLADARSLWRRVGDAVARRPLVFVVAAVVVLSAMAAGLSQVRLGLPTEEQFLDKPEAIVAAERLGESFPAGTSDPTIVITPTSDRAVVQDLQRRVEDTPGVESVRIGAQADGITQLDVILDSEPRTPAAEQTVRDLRAEVADVSGTHVTGGEAQSMDEADAAARDRLLILPLILGLVVVALIMVLRSVLAPVLLVLSVLATYVASLGVSWWIFTGILGFTALDTSVPLLTFLFLVALGVDYNIFLITRTLEEAKVVGTRAGVRRALSATGGVITSAGILLAAVFAVLGVLPLVVLAQIGVVICVGVLLDTLVVRTVVVPALVLAVGPRFWWPRHIDPVSTDH